MNIQLILKTLLVGVTGMLLTTIIVWAMNGGIKNIYSPGLSLRPTLTRGVAPEIDAASGTSAIALLTGVLLLVGERSWSKRSSKPEEQVRFGGGCGVL